MKHPHHNNNPDSLENRWHTRKRTWRTYSPGSDSTMSTTIFALRSTGAPSPAETPAHGVAKRGLELQVQVALLTHLEMMLDLTGRSRVQLSVQELEDPLERILEGRPSISERTTAVRYSSGS